MVNPYTGRLINVNGKTYKHVVAKLRGVNQGGGGGGDGLFDSLVTKATSMEPRVTGEGAAFRDTPVLPDSKYHLLNSNRPPNPTEHSWYHYHAPFSQNFGDYVCLKRSTLRDLGSFLKDALTADVNGGPVK